MFTYRASQGYSYITAKDNLKTVYHRLVLIFGLEHPVYLQQVINTSFAAKCFLTAQLPYHSYVT